MTDSLNQTRYVIINADDLGICQGVNEAVAEAHQFGILTSASLMANGLAFDHALHTVVKPLPRLGVGLHLCLTSGRCVSDPAKLPDLVDTTGTFRHGFFSLMRTLRPRPQNVLKQIRQELESQFKRAWEAGVEIDHVDGHRYVHMIPAVFEITTRLANDYGCAWIRCPNESLGPAGAWINRNRLMTRGRNLPKRVLLSYLAGRNRKNHSHHRFADHYRGILDSGAITSSTLQLLLKHLRPGVTEIATHPAKFNAIPTMACDQGDHAFLSAPARQSEFAALMNDDISNSTEKYRIQFVNYRNLEL